MVAAGRVLSRAARLTGVAAGAGGGAAVPVTTGAGETGAKTALGEGNRDGAGAAADRDPHPATPVETTATMVRPSAMENHGRLRLGTHRR